MLKEDTQRLFTRTRLVRGAGAVFLLVFILILPVCASVMSGRTQRWMAASPQERIALQVGAEFLGRGDVPLQQKDNTCGPASLSYALASFGIRVTEAELAALSGTSTNGTSMLGLAQAAARFGVEAKGLRVTPGRVEQLTLPAILFLPKLKHFVVLTTVSADHVIVADPAVGYLKFPKKALLKQWDGIALVLGNAAARPG